MPRSKRLIVGLGNPGTEYAGTRHNIGFEVVDALAERCDIALQSGRHQSLTGWGSHRGYPFGCAKPLTYVNRSGLAVRGLMQEHQLEPRELLVVVDDLHLPVGKLRLRPGGGSGGHNGLDDIAERLGTTDFPRLRIGIGQDFRRGQQADYVLSPFTPEQREVIDATIERACDAALVFVREGVEPAMNQFN
jgi:PTH1 family peptidyl-tRNA hydrolase